MRTLKFFAVLTISLSFFVQLPLSFAQSRITLGKATAELTGPWKFHTGDNMAWAEPGFDDSSWGTMDLTPPPGSFDPLIGSSGFVPGWTARGYAGHSGYAWYRLNVDIENGQAALAVKLPDNFDDAYQVYVNGRMVGEFGRFTAHGVTIYNAEPRIFPLPTDVRTGAVTIAIRMWMAPFTALVDPDAGGLHGPPVLGEAIAIGGLLHLDWDAIDRSFYGEFVEMAILLLALLVAFGLFYLDRKEPAYIWLGLTCAAILARLAVTVVANYTTWVDGNLVFFLQDAILAPLAIGLWVLFWAYWFRLVPMAHLQRVVWGLVFLLAVGMAMLRAPLYGSVVPVHAIVWLSPLTLALKLLLGVLLVWVTIRGIRKNKAEGWLALPAVVLVVVSLYQEELLVLHVPTQFFPFGVASNLTQIASILSLGIITVLLLERFLRAQREREHWKLEIEQARQVQQVLIPEAIPAIPGFTVESEYRPAQHVGGDFFQIIPGEDGSILAVVGDVSGKGLMAAMTVSMIVGAIRMVADATREPMVVLEGLNRRLCGRQQGQFATCVVLHIAQNGDTRIANAGHIAPYLNGEEVAIAGSLPLGITEMAEFEQARFTLQPGDRITLMTDGVIEAQNAHKELFGFTRTSQFLKQDKSAAEMATAAQQFGQEDDITVLRVVRVSGAGQNPLASFGAESA